MQAATEAVERFSSAIDGLNQKGTKPYKEMNKIELTAGIARATCEVLEELLSPLGMEDAKLALMIIPRQASNVESEIIKARSSHITPRSELRMLNATLQEDYLRPLLGISRIILDRMQSCPYRPLPLTPAQEDE